MFNLFKTIFEGPEQNPFKKNNPLVETNSTYYYTYIKITCSNTNGVQDTSAQYNSANSLNRYLNLLLKLKVPERYRRHIK